MTCGDQGVQRVKHDGTGWGGDGTMPGVVEEYVDADCRTASTKPSNCSNDTAQSPRRT
jgi:hypothetical protein